jgi:D-alanine-D-alanine ligase
MRIGLLFGGKSFEHDISIITANIVYQALREKHDVYLLYIDKKGEFRNPRKLIIDDFVNEKKFKGFSFRKGGIKVGCKNITLDVLIGLMHGLNGEDGLSSIVANLYDIPYVGCNHISSGIIIDKYFTYAILRVNGIETIHSKYYLKDDKLFIRKFPIIIKPARLGSSIGISKISNVDELDFKTKTAFMFDDKIIVQPFITNFKEYNQAAYFYNGEVIVSKVEQVFKSDEILTFEDKYITTKTEKKHVFITEQNLIDKISTITKSIYKLFEMSGIVRIDYMLFNDEVYVNEINTTPGSLAYYLFEEEILTLIEKQIHTALMKHQNRKETVFESSVLNQNYSYKK